MDPDQARIWPDKTSDVIWIQTVWHSTGKLILKKISADDKTITNYLVGKKSQRIEMEGATCTCMFHA